MKLFMDIHVIQNVPPSCLNRDDTGSPKTAMYGGVRRARVSSQCWKRAMRTMFNETLDKNELSYRTLKIFDLIAEEIQKQAPEKSSEDAIKLAKDILAKVKVTPSKKDASNADALFFMSTQQAKNLATLALGNIDDKDITKTIVQTLKQNNGIDLALFGRMVASNPEINCDASAQVAHAISTHRVESEYDYFTAVDDFANNDHAGAGMIGTVEFNSSTLYRYATVAVHELKTQLANDPNALEKALSEFVRAFVLSLPDGKQNTFAARTIPYAVMVGLRTDRPLNLADAFEKPVKSNDGYAANSVAAFTDHAEFAYKNFCARPVKSYIVGHFQEQLGTSLNVDGLVTQAASDAIAILKA